MGTHRFVYADAFKLLAMLGVVLAHLPRHGRFSPDAWNLVSVAQEWTGWCVLAFFAVSGVLFSARPIGSLGEELGRRAKRLLVPWVSFSVLYKVAIGLLAAIGLVTKYPPPPTDLSQLCRWALIPAAPQLYFLPYLFLVQVVGVAVAKRGSVVYAVAGCLGLGIWLSWSLQTDDFKLLHGPQLQLLPLYFAFFFGGAFAAGLPPRMFLTAGILFAAGGVVWIAGYPPSLAFQIAAPFALLAVMQQFNGARWEVPLAFAGAFAGGVYVWHAPLVISAATIASIFLFGNGVAAALLAVLSSYLVAASVGAVVNRTRWLSWFRM